MNNILVTGSTGQLGSYVVKELLKRGYVPLDYNSSDILIKEGIYFKLQ